MSDEATHDGAPTAAPVASVAIPAYNEAAVLRRCLDALLADARPGELEIVVACNGCTDDSAAVAASYDGVRVVELAQASKVAALNAADEHLTAFPRFYVDADVEVSTQTVRTLVTQMDSLGALCGAPHPVFETSGRPYLIRAFYEVWSDQPYLRQQPVGNGVYVLTEEGRRRFGRFPDLVSDDLFVRNCFHISERYCSPDVSFTIHAPRKVSGLVRMRVRVHRGNAQLARAEPKTDAQHGQRYKALLRTARTPGALSRVAVYIGINLAARLVAKWKRLTGARAWERDESARELTPGEAS